MCCVLISDWRRVEPVALCCLIIHCIFFFIRPGNMQSFPKQQHDKIWVGCDCFPSSPSKQPVPYKDWFWQQQGVLDPGGPEDRRGLLSLQLHLCIRLYPYFLSAKWHCGVPHGWDCVRGHLHTDIQWDSHAFSALLIAYTFWDIHGMDEGIHFSISGPLLPVMGNVNV